MTPARSRAGISPVIATVILVAVAIVIAIAVAFWATGLVGIFTKYEKFEVTNIYAAPTGANPNEYYVYITAKNTGTSSATIDNVYINGQPMSSPPSGFQVTAIASGGGTSCTATSVEVGNLQVTCNPGEVVELTLTLTAPSPGLTIEVTLHSAAGKTYPASVLLP